MKADSYTLHVQIYVSGVTSAADPTASHREDREKEGKTEGKKERNQDRRKEIN